MAFPLTPGTTQPVQNIQPGGSLPPSAMSLPPATNIPAQGDLFIPASIEVLKDQEDANVHLTIVSDILDDCVKKFLEADKTEDINKRLQLLYSSWEDKLNPDIQRRLSKLCSLLQEKNFAEAETVQVALAVDYTTECAGWIVVIKFIISVMKEKS